MSISTAQLPKKKDSRHVINQPAHGLSLMGNDLPLPAYVDASNEIQPADASDPAKTKAFFVTRIIDADNVEIMHTGFLSVPSHGLTVGDYYYVSDSTPGALVGTAPSQNDIVVYVVNSDTLNLIDKRII